MESVNFHKKYGENLVYSKLKNTDIPIIRQRLSNGETSKQIAIDYKVCTSTIQNIKSGWAWTRF